MTETQADLFGGTPPETPQPPAGVTYRQGLFRGRFTFAELRAVLPLRQSIAHMYGKDLPAPRLECWHGNHPYAFGGRVTHPEPWPELLLEVRDAVEESTATRFDSCFANLYRDGQDHIPWHSDSERWMGPTIASVTFGAARRFVLKRTLTDEKHEWQLGDGDLLVMGPGIQELWQHSVPRTAARVGPRLNLTFRQDRA